MLGSRYIAIAIALLSSGCSPRVETKTERIRLWHTFSAAETEGLNDVLGDRDDVEISMISFARGHFVLRDILASGALDCPDLIRIDASWLPALAPYLRPTPLKLDADRTWLAEADELSRVGETRLALPQSLDGLALIARSSAVLDRPNWPPSSYDSLIVLAQALSADYEFGLDLRLDAFWFVPFLRAVGGHLLDPVTGELGIDRPAAAAALARFSNLFDKLAPRPGAAGSDFREEVRRFRDNKVALVINGPWAIDALAGGNRDSLAIAPLPRSRGGDPSAVIGGQLFVVPRCAKRPEQAWLLASDLTAPSVQSAWGQQFGSVPTTREALVQSGPIAQTFYGALAGAHPLPRHAVTPDLFDDLTPAIAAVVAGDATAEEALGGAARAWTRMRRRHKIPSPLSNPTAGGAR